MSLDYVMIGYKLWTIDETYPVVLSEGSAYRNFLRKHVAYDNKKFYYNDLYTYLLNGNLDIEKGYKKSYFSVHEIPYLSVLTILDFLRNNGLKAEGINLFDAERERLDHLLDQSPTFVGISTSAFTSVAPIVRIVRYVRNRSPESKIVLGGAYLYDLYWHSEKAFLESIKVLGGDYYVVEPQGERTLLELIQKHKNSQSVKDVCNVFIMENGTVHFKKFERELNDLDRQAIRWDRVDPHLLSTTVLVRTSRGCPFKCKFCYYPLRNNKLQMASIETVEKELRQINEHGVKTVVFVDDMLNTSKKRINELCKMIIRNKFNFSWCAYMRLDNLSEESAYLLAESNCAGVLVGIETANNKILELMCKKITVETYKQSLTWLNQYSVNTLAFILTGFPGETKETVQETIDLLNSGLINYYMVNLWYAHKGTPVYGKDDEFGLTGDGFEWKHSTMDHKIASDLTDEMVKKVTNSIYIPPGDFGMLSIPYLLGKGFTLPQVDQLLIYTNKLMMRNIGVPCDEQECIAKITDILRRCYETNQKDMQHEQTSQFYPA